MYKKQSWVLVISILFSAGIKNLNAQQWQQKAQVPEEKSGSVCLSVNDRIFLAEGNGVSGFYEYLPVSDNWVTKAPMPSSRSGYHSGISFTINGKGYIGLGAASGWHSDLWEYDPVTDAWMQKASLPAEGREGAACFVVNNKAYVIGGASLNRFNEVWEYDPVSNSWLQKNNFPEGPIIFATGFSINNTGYVQGGYPDNSNNQVTTSTYEYNAANDSWSLKAAFPATARQAHKSFVLNNKAYIGLGTNTLYETCYKDFYSYDPTVNTWTQEEDFPGTARMFAFATSAGGRGYIGGGNLSFSNIATDFFQFTPDGNTGVNNIQARTASISCFPNPTNQNLTLLSDNDEFSSASYFIYDGTGRCVSKGITKYSEPIAVSHLSEGHYIISVKTKNGYQCIPFIVKH
jgi:N-acetylneuraminic acid mutarotase